MGLSAPLESGWAQADCTGPVKAGLLFRQYDSAGAPTGEKRGSMRRPLPATRFVTFAEKARRAGGDRSRLRQPIRHGDSRGHLYGPGRGGADAGQRRSDPDARGAWRAKHGGPVQSHQLYGIARNHLQQAHRQPVDQYRSRSGFLLLAAGGTGSFTAGSAHNRPGGAGGFLSLDRRAELAGAHQLAQRRATRGVVRGRRGRERPGHEPGSAAQRAER